MSIKVKDMNKVEGWSDSGVMLGLGRHLVRIDSAEENPGGRQSSGGHDQVELTFVAENGAGSIRDWIYPVAVPGKAKTLLEAAGIEVQEGEWDFPTDRLPGRKLTIRVGEERKYDGSTHDDGRPVMQRKVQGYSLAGDEPPASGDGGDEGIPFEAAPAIVDRAVPSPEHRELTEPEKAELRTTAFNCERAIKAGVGQMHAAWWELAEAVYVFRELRGHELLGYDTLAEFLAQPEIGMTERHFNRMAKLWEDLVIRREIEVAVLHELEPSKVREVTPAIVSGDVAVEDALADVRALGYRDLRAKYHGPADEDEPVRVQCPRCQSWVPAGKLGAA